MYSPARTCELQLPDMCNEGMGASAGDMTGEADLVKSSCQVVGKRSASTCGSKGIGIRYCWGTPTGILPAQPSSFFLHRLAVMPQADADNPQSCQAARHGTAPHSFLWPFPVSVLLVNN